MKMTNQPEVKLSPHVIIPRGVEDAIEGEENFEFDDVVGLCLLLIWLYS